MMRWVLFVIRVGFDMMLLWFVDSWVLLVGSLGGMYIGVGIGEGGVF